MADVPYEAQSFRIASDSQQIPYIVKQEIPGRGFGLVTQGKIFKEARETVVWIPKPLTVTIETSKLQERCYQCLRMHISDVENQQMKGNGAYATIKSCVGCQTVKYCGKKCQSRSWKEHHKYECKIFGGLQPRVLPSPVRTVIRLLKHRENGQIGNQDWNSLLALESHQDELSSAGGERWQDVFLMAKAVQKYSGTKVQLEVILRICCILTVNSFTLTDAVLEPLGMVFDPMAAMLNHSCDPNCIVRFDAETSTSTLQNTSSTDPILGSVSIDLIRPVQKAEELTISYIDNTFPRSKRQSDLSSRYFFTCACSRCSQGLDTPFDKLLKPSVSTTASDAESLAIKVLEAATSKTSNLPMMIPMIRFALSRLAQTATFPIQRYPYASLRLQLVLALIASGAWYKAMLQSGVIVYRIDPLLYSQPHHPIRIVNKWRLCRLARHLCVEKLDAKNVPPVSEDEEMMLKLTVVISITTLQFERPQSTVTTPASTLDKMLSDAKAEIMPADLVEQGRLERHARPGALVEPVQAYRLAPRRIEEDLKKRWDELIDNVLREETEYEGTADQMTEKVRELQVISGAR